MAEEAKKKEEPAGHGTKGEAGATKKGGIGALLGKMPVLLGGAMVIEAVVLFAGFKMLGGGPKAAEGADLTTEETQAADADSHASSSSGGDHDAASSAGSAKKEDHGSGAGKVAAPVDRKKPVEIQVVDFRAPNKQSGRTFLYDVTIFVSTRGEFKDRVEATIKEREALIKDRVRTIIAQCDPEKLGGGSEPGLETLRRQVKYQLDEIVGEGMIDEVLVPRCIPFRTDY